MLQKNAESRPSASELHSARLPPLMVLEEDPPVINAEDIANQTQAKCVKHFKSYVDIVLSTCA